MTSNNFICLILCNCIFSSLFILPTSSFRITLNLSPIPKLHSSQNPKDIIYDIAQSSLVRAFKLKHINNNQLLASTPNTPLTPEGGEYSISLSLGTPPQDIPVIFDTGSSLVWVPCTSGYTCLNCTENNATITFFDPLKSSTDYPTECSNIKCSWLDEPNSSASCSNCSQTTPGSCTKPCSYLQVYGSGATTGLALFESLNLQEEVVPDIFVGCSVKSLTIAQGIAGFGRVPMSLPNQLGLTQFSHCLVPHKLEDTGSSSKLILGESGVLEGVGYTPLLKNPTVFPFNHYYYVQLDEIIIGGKIIKIPNDTHVPNNNGNGGTIIDSGSTLTFMVSTVFNPIVVAFVSNMTTSQLKQVTLEQLTLGTILCVNVSGQSDITFPEITFNFKGGAKMDLPVDNYFNPIENYLCLPFANTTNDVGAGGGGPAIILGNYQQQNMHIEYDLKNERLGFKKQDCGGT